VLVSMGSVVAVRENIATPLLGDATHSFYWGYSGAGANQLAKAILTDYLKIDNLDPELVAKMRERFIADLSEAPWEISGDQIREFLLEHVSEWWVWYGNPFPTDAEKAADAEVKRRFLRTDSAPVRAEVTSQTGTIYRGWPDPGGPRRSSRPWAAAYRGDEVRALIDPVFDHRKSDRTHRSGGSYTGNLAFAILTDFIGTEPSRKMLQAFAQKHFEPWDASKPWEVDETSIRTFLAEHKDEIWVWHDGPEPTDAERRVDATAKQRVLGPSGKVDGSITSGGEPSERRSAARLPID
jgi:hypothetical protein